MRFEKFDIEGVDKKGKVNAGGSVYVDGKVIMLKGQGCGLPSCHCSDGISLTLLMPRNENGIVEGIRVVFANKKEMWETLK